MRGRYEARRKSVGYAVAVILAVFLVLAILLALRACEPSELPETPVGTGSPDSIAVPGYEMLTLKAGQAQQTLCLPNPQGNPCYFQISLSLADGTLLWCSEPVPPGGKTAPIRLSKPLEAGFYPDATLKYTCLSLEDGKTLMNGAESKLTLRVQ